MPGVFWEPALGRLPVWALESGLEPGTKWIATRIAFPQQPWAGDDATPGPPVRRLQKRRDGSGLSPSTPAAPPPAALANQRPGAAASASF